MKGCVAQVGWEQRGNNQYYYKKEREGSRVKSVYVGRGEIAQMVSQIQSSSTLVERVARGLKSPEAIKFEQAEKALDQAAELVEHLTIGALLAAGFQIHKRQWRRKRNVLLSASNAVELHATARRVSGSSGGCGLS